MKSETLLINCLNKFNTFGKKIYSIQVYLENIQICLYNEKVIIFYEEKWYLKLLNKLKRK